MESRLVYSEVEPDSLKAMMQLETYVCHSGLDATLLELTQAKPTVMHPTRSLSVTPAKIFPIMTERG